jgi:flagellar motor component MotA
MAFRLLIPLGISAVSVGVALGVRSSPEHQTLSSVLMGVGVSIGACVGAFLIARSFKIDRLAAGAPDADSRLSTLASDLVAVAEAVERRGMLALAESKVSVLPEIYHQGAMLAVSGADPARLRSTVSTLIETSSGAAMRSARKSALFAQVMGIAALSIALTVVAASVFSQAMLGFSDAAALAIMLLVYGAFMLTVIAQELASRVAIQAKESTLAGVMIGESLAHLRVGAGPGVIRSEIERLLAPNATPVPSVPAISRRAA